FLADSDLLCNAWQDMSQHPWSPSHLTMDTHFKMCHVCEEIQCLNIKIRQLATYLHDKSWYLMECKKQLQTLYPGLAYQVALHSKIHMRLSGHHHCLHEISMLQGF
ncbi:hypothetical protein BDR05DRAFT_860723, partial [Suillus weaverae]